MKIKDFIKSTGDIFVAIVFLSFNFFLILKPKNFKKIKSAKLIVLHQNGGFGHQVLVNDMLRYEDSSILYILFYDPTRFNKYVSEIFNIQSIYLKTCVGKNLEFIKNPLKFGEYEGSKYKINNLFIEYFLNKILKKKTFHLQNYYQYVEKKNSHLKNSKLFKLRNFQDFNFYGDIHFYKLKNFPQKKPGLNTKKKVEKILRKTNNYFSSKKICTFYLRQKGVYSNDITNKYRVGSNKEDYIKVFKYLISKGYAIFLVGDKLYEKKDLNKFNNKVISSECIKINKDLFQMYACTNCEIFISEPGGCQYFGLYAPISIGINYFPIGYKPPFTNILYKNIKSKISNNKISINNKIKWKYNFKDKNIFVGNNTSDEIYNFIKKVYNDKKN